MDEPIQITDEEIEALRADLDRPVLPGVEELRRQTEGALARARALLRLSEPDREPRPGESPEQRRARLRLQSRIALAWARESLAKSAALSRKP